MLTPPGMPRRRNRVLTPDEIRTLWAELDHPEAFGFTADTATALRLILATAARPGMVTGMLREELIDLDAPQPRPVLWGQLREVTEDDASNGPIWQLSHERMKGEDDGYDSTDPFIAPLNGDGGRADQGRARPRQSPGARPGADQRQGHDATMQGNAPAALMRAIWKKHGFAYARPHDLRRTAATLVQSAVLPDRPMKWSVEEVGWLLGHRNEKGGPVTLVYARYDHFDEKRAMAATLERELNRILGASGPRGGIAAQQATRQGKPRLQMVEHLTGDGSTIFEHACKNSGWRASSPSAPICPINRAAPSAGSRSRTGSTPRSKGCARRSANRSVIARPWRSGRRSARSAQRTARNTSRSAGIASTSS